MTIAAPQAGRAGPAATRLAALSAGQVPTPMLGLRATVGRRQVLIRLKLEAAGLWGSIKGRTALSLAASVAGRLARPGAVLVESTSGNLGVALAEIAMALDRHFVAVVDPKLSPALRERLTAAGAELSVVSDRDDQGGYLDARLARVASLLRNVPGAIWTDQYHNPANPLAHYRQTAPELLRQAGDADAVFVAVSTGGTLTGISRYLRRHAGRVRVVGVDVPGSRVFGRPSATRILTGIGASRSSVFLRPGDWDDTVLVRDATAIAVCHEVRRATGHLLGGSSGAVVAACLRYLEDHPEIVAPVCVCPDGGESYATTLYATEWLAGRSIDPETWPPELAGAGIPHQEMCPETGVG